MNILGISCFFHDSSATLIQHGKIVAAAEEERFSRKKHDNSFPVRAIEYCLKAGGISGKTVDYVAFYEKPVLKFERVMYQHLEMFPKSYKTFVYSMPSWLNEKLRVVRSVRKLLKSRIPVLFVDHHLAHAASSFYVSPFSEAAVLTVDGVGEWTTMAYGVGRGISLDLIGEICFPHSLGLLYSTVTAYLGFSVNNSEYKVMGLSAFGNMEKDCNPYVPLLRRVIDIRDDGSFELDLSYFEYHWNNRMPSRKLCNLLGGPVVKRDEALAQRHKDIAAALQLILEEVMFKALCYVHRETKLENVVLAGGCALNSVCNGKLLRNTPFKKVWIQPNATDGGTSLGAAYYLHHALLKHPRSYVQQSAFLGPEFNDREIEQFLEDSRITYSRFSDVSELLNRTASLIYQGNVVGWFQGRMEWGPRALGARSILADPTRPDIKDLLNVKVKHREKFRPFAPVVCVDDAKKYFECDEPIPEPTDFMLMVYPVKQKYRNVIPGVTHVDGSGRLQTIRRDQHPLYYDLIRTFGKLSGVPILVNTSFNIRGEPIVCTPSDAYRCMMGTGIDYLVMGNFLVRRDDNPRDIWDSESYADD